MKEKILGYLKENKRRIFMSLGGVIICAVSVGVFKLAAFGVDPFQSLMSGLDAMIPIGFGNLYVIVNVILLLFSIIADRHNRYCDIYQSVPAWTYYAVYL